MKFFSKISPITIGAVIFFVLVGGVALSILKPDWNEKYLIPASKIIGFLSLSCGVWIAVGDYHLKVAAEVRLNESTQIENDIQLLKMFSETFDIAENRKSTVLSDKVIEKLFDKNHITPQMDDNTIRGKLKLAGIIVDIGVASQIAAVSAIGELGAKHPLLKAASLNGLTNLQHQAPLVGLSPTIQASIDKINAAK